MDDVVFVRHGESETAAGGIVGGDAPLTEAGREQALALARELGDPPLDLCVTSVARRARETAAILVAGQGVPVEVDAELGDIDFGVFDGAPLAEYRAWIESHPPDEGPPGGESRAATLRRFAGAFRRLLARPERHLLVVAHGLTLSALVEGTPRPVVAGVPYGSSLRLSHDDLAAAVARIEAWVEDPAW